MPEVAANVFLDRVVDGAVAGELTAHLPVLPGFVGHQIRLAVNVRHEDRAQGLGRH